MGVLQKRAGRSSRGCKGAMLVLLISFPSSSSRIGTETSGEKRQLSKRSFTADIRAGRAWTDAGLTTAAGQDHRRAVGRIRTRGWDGLCDRQGVAPGQGNPPDAASISRGSV